MERWLLRMARWARRPPSRARLLLVVTVIALCLALLVVERLFGWPDWLTPSQFRPASLR